MTDYNTDEARNIDNVEDMIIALQEADGVSVDDNGGSLTIDTADGAIDVNQSGSVSVDEPIDVDPQDITDGIENINGKADGHFSADSHTHIHRHLGELYSTGYYWANASQNTDYEIYFRNPTGSGKNVEIITTSVTTDVGIETRLFKEFSWPDTGNTLSPVNTHSGFSDGINSDVEYGTDNADGGTLIPPVTISPAATSGNPSSRIPSIQQNPASDYELDEGEVYSISVTPQSDGKLSLGLLIAEYDDGRRIE